MQGVLGGMEGMEDGLLRKKNINLSQLGPLGVHCFYLFLQYFDHHVQRLETHNWQQIWIQQQHIHVRKKKRHGIATSNLHLHTTT